MLDAAMLRTYSAAPVSFFTGGGENSFGNFEPWENTLLPTVDYAFENSINCAFVRLMRDVRGYYTAQSGIDEKKLLSDPHDPARAAYLQHFAATEGRGYLYGFYTTYHGLTPPQALDRLASRTTPLASHLADIFFAVYPDASQGAMTAFLQTHMPKPSFAELTSDRLLKLYQEFCASKFSLNDKGYIAGVHPLEIWLVIYLQTHPAASWNEVAAASPTAIQQSYAWLFKPDAMFQQNVRIVTLLEQDAFRRIWQDWRRQGYPFDHLVPSLGTAIGASGDRPDALANLMGIILNGGVQVPTVDLDRLNFADGTPYQTDFVSQGSPQQVLDPAVVATVRHALLGVVQQWHGQLRRGGLSGGGWSVLPVGGKTGSGDNRYHIYGPGGALRGERVVDRTATFVFFLGDRFFGTVTAYVPGPPAANFTFTSAMSVQLLKALKPQLDPLLHAPAPTSCPSRLCKGKWRKLSRISDYMYWWGLFPGALTGFSGCGFGNVGSEPVGYGLGRVFGFEHQNGEFGEFGEVFFGWVKDPGAHREWGSGPAGDGEAGDDGDHGTGRAAGGIGDAVAAAGFLQGPDRDPAPGAVMLGQRQRQGVLLMGGETLGGDPDQGAAHERFRRPALGFLPFGYQR